MQSIHDLENFIYILLQSLGSWIQTPAGFLSFLGSEEFYLLIMPVLYWCVNAGLGLRIGLILTISASLNGVLKLAFHTPRPYWVDSQVNAYATETSFGLPSGHSQNSAAIWGLASFHARRRWLTWVSVVVIFLIGISRIALGVHYLMDVLIGWIVGALILFLFIRLDQPVLAWVRRQSTGRLFLYCVFSSLVFIFMVVGVDRALGEWQIPAEWVSGVIGAGQKLADLRNLDRAVNMGGIWLGLTGGALWIFRRVGGFHPRGDLFARALCYLIGLIGVLGFWYGLGAVFPRNQDFLSYSLRYLRYALLGGWVAAGAPWLFKRLGLVK